MPEPLAREPVVHRSVTWSDLGDVDMVDYNSYAALREQLTQVNVTNVELKEDRDLAHARLVELYKEVAQVTQERDSWKNEYVACHALHLKAVEEVEEKNIFNLQVRAIDAEQQLATAQARITRLERELRGILGTLSAYRKTGGIQDGCALQGWEMTAQQALAQEAKDARLDLQDSHPPGP